MEPLRSALPGGVGTVKADEHGSPPFGDEASEPAGGPGCDPIIDDVDELISSIDCGTEAGERRESPGEDDEEGAGKVSDVRSPDVPDEAIDTGAVPWLDRYQATNDLICKLEDTLRMMERQGVNLTTAWELANTARSLLESADVAQALIYANRSFRMAQDLHRFPDSQGVAAS